MINYKDIFNQIKDAMTCIGIEIDKDSFEYTETSAKPSFIEKFPFSCV